jgi:hypothetical protein
MLSPEAPKGERLYAAFSGSSASHRVPLRQMGSAHITVFHCFGVVSGIVHLLHSHNRARPLPVHARELC